MRSSVWLAAACLVGASGAAWALDSAAPAPAALVTSDKPGPNIGFIAHRAVYDLELGETRGSSNVETMRGRIVYDFSGNACDGYALKFRQVTQIGVSGGGQNTSDLRSATFEDDHGKSFRFTSQNYINQKLDTSIDGQADRTDSGEVGVSLKQPKTTTFQLPQGVTFPTLQMKEIVGAALAGESVFESKIYDGSDGGEKVFSTLAVIGKKIAADKPREGAAAVHKELDGVDRWPVTISYFDPTKSTVGEQTPVYSMSFDLYANGISGNIRLDYGDFTLTGKMSSLEFLPQGKCN